MAKTLDKLISDMREQYEIPGLAVCAGTSAQGMCYKKAFGYKNAQTKEPLLPEHIFHMASVTKLFTGTCVMKLVEAGKVELDRCYVDYVPWFTMESPRHKKITIRQMLSHTTGMGDCGDYHWDRPQTHEAALKDYAESREVYKLPFLFEPGEPGKFLYCNVAYELLGVLIEEVAETAYDVYVKEAVLEPLEMADSTLLTFTRDMDQVCAPHGRDGRGPLFIYEHFPYTRDHGPSSTLTSNLEDISKFAEAVLAKRPVVFKNRDTFEQVWRQVSTVPNNGEGIGLSWFIRQQEGFTLFGHEGTDDGFRSSLWLCPEKDLYVAVLGNLSGCPVKKINKAVFQQLV